MDWWIWAIFGMALMVLEVATPGGFYLLFFGIGAVFVGLLVSLGAIEPLWLQWLIFTTSSVLALLLFRRPILEKFRTANPGKEVDKLVGEVAVALEDLLPLGLGRVELRGTAWSGRNVSSSLISKGNRCRVESIDGLTLAVRSESQI